MPKGTEHHRDERKKPKLSLKEKRLRKKEKKMKQTQQDIIVHEDFSV